MVERKWWKRVDAEEEESPELSMDTESSSARRGR